MTAQVGSKKMTSSSDNEEDTRIYITGTDVEDDAIRYCQEQTVEWVSEILTLTGGFGETDPSLVKHGPEIVDIWDDLKVPSRNKLSALSIDQASAFGPCGECMPYSH